MDVDPIVKAVVFVIKVLNSAFVAEILPVPDVVIGKRITEYLTKSIPVDENVLSIDVGVGSNTLTPKIVKDPAPEIVKNPYELVLVAAHESIILMLDVESVDVI